MYKIINNENMQKTALTRAKPTDNFLRTSVPQFVVKKLGLDPSWELSWDLDKKNDEWVIIIKPMKKETKKKSTS